MNNAELADIIRNQHIALRKAVEEYDRTGRRFTHSLLEDVRQVQYRLEILEREVKDSESTESA